MANSDLFIYILISALLIVLSAFAVRQRIRNRQLERLLDATNAKLEQLQINFGRFAPQDVIEHLTEAGGDYIPNKRVVTVLFADLIGFTRMSDQMAPEEVVPILNGYFRCMSNVITEHHGRVTELLGDGLLALFGALEPNPWQATDAVMGGLAMRNALAVYNKELKEKGLPELAFGIGIHQGEVLAGVMGNAELSKFGVVGDPINVASRVEALNRIHESDLLITEAVREKLDHRFLLKPMPPARVKGKQELLATYLVEGMETLANN